MSTFLPTKEQWDKSQRVISEQALELTSIRAALGLATGEEVVALLEECRAVFDHVPGPKGETFRDLIYRIAQQQQAQASTITELKSQLKETDKALHESLVRGPLIFNREIDDYVYIAAVKTLAQMGFNELSLNQKITSHAFVQWLFQPAE